MGDRLLTADGIDSLLERAREAGREVLLEPEALEVAAALGLQRPTSLFVADAERAAVTDLSELPGSWVVVKVVSPEIVHKSERGGVAVVAKRRSAVCGVVREMSDRFAGASVAGFTVSELVAHEDGFGGELLVGMRWTEEFGPVVSFGPGGVHAELLAASLANGRGAAILSPILGPAAVEETLAAQAVVPAITAGLRGRPPRISLAALGELPHEVGVVTTSVPAVWPVLPVDPGRFRGEASGDQR